MSTTRARVPSGFPEFAPREQFAFNEMLEKIRRTYAQYGFVPLETPAVEFEDVLLAKGGGDNEHKMYRLSRPGEEKQADKKSPDICLHFDLTVPLARYVAQNYDKLAFPFRRYQIQKVWRGDRPQAGRFHEFYQCDIDVIGTSNLLADAEIPSVIYSTFRLLGFNDFTIKVSNRKILNGKLRQLGYGDNIAGILHILDKFDKQGRDTIVEALETIEVGTKQAHLLIDFMSQPGSPCEIINFLQTQDISDDEYDKGVSELKAVTDAMILFGVPRSHFRIDLGVVRGLDYYTGTVYETTLEGYPQVGSVCSGGRYDNLIRYYSDHDLPGVGISIGLTRLFSTALKYGLVSAKAQLLDAMVAHHNTGSLPVCIAAASALRHNGISTEIYFDDDPIGKQLKYANKVGIPYVVIVDCDAVMINVPNNAGQVVILKDMATGEQERLPLLGAISRITNRLHRP